MRLFNRKPDIKFHTSDKLIDIIPHPVPAHKAMPDWFRKIKPSALTEEKSKFSTVKRCVPVLDAVSQGFIIPLWCDLQVKVTLIHEFMDDDGVVVHRGGTAHPDIFMGQVAPNTDKKITTYKKTDELAVWMSFSDDQGFEIGTHTWEQVGRACDLKKFELGKVLLKFTNPWVIETPKGYSVQIKNPSNNWSNDIQLLEGVVDTDEYYNEINLPYVWTGQKLGEFIIPRGSPLAHVIPFKRQGYDLKVGLKDEARNKKVTDRMETKFFDRYRSFYWHKRK